MASFLNKVALITGASSGIGKGVALHLASLGCSLSLSGRNRDNLNDTRLKCLESSKGLVKEDQIIVVEGDLIDEANRINLVSKTLAHFGKIDILVNSAGIIAKGNVDVTPLDVWDKIMDVNVKSVFHLMQLTIPHLKKTKGNIVNVSSVNGLRAFAGVAAYCVSKSAVDQLTRNAALELAADGVRVNAVNPGVIVTDIHKRGGMNDQEYAAFLEKSKTTHPLGRPGTVDEVARAIRFLADNQDSSFITGVTLSVDGGRNLVCPR
ncbi:3-oxoacyl-[acyl-carrier-protein] reductase FabG-like [Panonychus citri]|uniref:3-oxoacyl-[acyl-carrier-protein] reductase FabG-like n=1 Tax=Panonychus citri TaxID=50023 RepID=UPI002307B81D|nr:3-oxoacyl-[acyl-carrier-protein] reductase FabG-like [Panonychus citri]